MCVVCSCLLAVGLFGLLAVCCLLSAVLQMLVVVGCCLLVGDLWWFVVFGLFCLLLVDQSVLFAAWLFVLAFWLLDAGWCLFLLRVVCVSFCALRCLLYVACSLLFIVCCLVFVLSGELRALCWLFVEVV